MRVRSTLILASLVLALGAYLWFVERGRPTADERSEHARRVVRLTAGDVERIAITRGPVAQREMIELVRDDKGGWRMVAPVTARADAGRAAGLATQIEFLEGERQVADPDLKALGLDPPRLLAELGTGEQTLTLRFGHDDPTGRRVYLEAGGEVHAADRSVLDALDKPVAEFRDRRALPIESFRVQHVAFEWREQGLMLSRKKGGWFIEAPIGAAADGQEVERLLQSLAELRAEALVADSGQIEAAARIVVTLDDGEQRTLSLAEPSEGRRRAVLSGEPFLIAIKQADLAGLLPPDPGLLRDRQVFHLRADSVEALVVRRGEQRISLQKDGAHSSWRLSGSEHTVAGHKVDARIRALTELRAERVAPLAGNDAHPLPVHAVVQLRVGKRTEGVDLVAYTGEGAGRRLRLTRHGQTAQLICKAEVEALFSADEKDFLSGLAEPGHDHVHDHLHGHEH